MSNFYNELKDKKSFTVIKHASFDQASNRMLLLTEPYSNNIIKIIKDIMNTTNRS